MVDSIRSKIAVTGVSGYIGRRITPMLVDAGYSVVGIDRAAVEAPLAASIEFVQADLLDASEYETALASVDTVVHLAAAKGDWGISRDEYYRDNVEATRALLSSGTSARRWVFYSTVSALGPSAVPLAEDAVPGPKNDYGASKLECEQLFHELAAGDPSREITIIRPSVVFGPENPWNTNIFRLIDAIRRRRFVMIGDGAVYKTTSYIENLVAATLFLMDRFAPGVQIYHYLDEPVISTEELVSEIYRLLQIRRPSLRLSLGLTRQIAKIADIVADWTGRDLPITSARIEKFCTDTNFESRKVRDEGFEQPVSMQDALEATVNWYIGEYLREE